MDFCPDSVMAIQLAHSVRPIWAIDCAACVAAIEVFISCCGNGGVSGATAGNYGRCTWLPGSLMLRVNSCVPLPPRRPPPHPNLHGSSPHCLTSPLTHVNRIFQINHTHTILHLTLNVSRC